MHPIRPRTASRRLVAATLAALLAGHAYIAPAHAAGPPGPPTNLTAAAGSPVDGIEETARTDAVPLTYTAGTGRYQYTWRTERSWAGTCRELIVRFRDGSEQRALFKLR